MSNFDSDSLVLEAAEILWPQSEHDFSGDTVVHVVMNAMSVRMSRLLRACRTLVGAGYSHEALVLVRSIWEDVISAYFIAESPKERSKLWVDYCEKRRINHIKEALKKEDYFGGHFNEIKSLLSDAEAIESKCHDWWSECKLSKMVETIQRSSEAFRCIYANDFSAIYSYLCDVAHGSPLMIDQLLEGNPGKVTVNVGPDFTNKRPFSPNVLAIYGAFHFGQAKKGTGLGINVERLLEMIEQIHKGECRPVSSGC